MTKPKKLKVVIQESVYMRSSSDIGTIWHVKFIDDRAYKNTKQDAVKFCGDNNFELVAIIPLNSKKETL